MKKNAFLLPFLLSFTLLQGCAGGLILAAATTVVVTSDERSMSTQIADDNLALQAIDKITELAFNHREIRINMNVNNGYLLVVGQVTNDQQKNKIEAKLNTLKGVKQVYNQLRINKAVSLAQQSKDIWITTKVKAKLTAHKNINSFKIKVITENGEVFLIGSIDEKTADLATNVARKLAGVKRVNRVFQIIVQK